MSTGFVAAEIVEPYAEALKELAQSADLLDRVGEELTAVKSLVEESSDLSYLFHSPAYDTEQKKGVIRRLFDGKVHDYVLSFLLLLVDRKRIVCLPAIVDHYQVLLRGLKGISLAEVTVAVALTSDQEASLQDKVKTMTSAREVELKITIDPEILGGVIIKVGSEVFDASLRGQLRRIGISLGV